MQPPPTASTSSGLPTTVTLTPQVLNTLKPAKVFRSHNEQGKAFTSLGFDSRGEMLITSGEDETMQLFDVKTGKHVKQLYSKKYGVHLARFTHKSSTIVHASTKGNDDIRYLSLHDNNYLRYFKGHKKQVVSLAMSPQDDTFFSGAADDTVRLWDLRTQNAQGLLNVAGHPCVAYDPSGSVFAVVLNLRSTVMMYDLKNFDKQPFLCKHIDDPVLRERTYPPRTPIYTSCAFSNDGKLLLVGTSGDVHYVLDAFEGTVVARLELPQGPQSATGLERSPQPPHERPMEPTAGISSEEVSWSPDGRFVLSGSITGQLHIWDVAPPSSSLSSLYPDRPPPGPACTLFPMRSTEGHLGGPSRAVQFNPRTAMVASAGGELAFWLPDPAEGAYPRQEGS
ncbi:hypothetical protein JCM8547_005179 [Rhodosporidiobolus lusitaniae]